MIKYFFFVIFQIFFLFNINAQPQQKHYHTGNSALKDDYISDIEFDKDGTAYVATWGGGLVKVNGDNWTLIKPNDKYDTKLINQIKQDKYGTWWVATDRSGVFSIRNNSWIYHPLEKDNIALAVAPDDKNNIWIGTYEHGLYKLNNGKLQKMWAQSDYFESGVNDILFGSNKTWIATRIGVLESMNNEWIKHIWNGAVYDLELDSKGNIWALTEPGGSVAKYDGRVWKYFNYKEKKVNKEMPNYIVSMHIDKYDQIFLGDGNGNLLKFYDDKWEKIPVDANIPDLRITAINKDTEGNIWIGTSNNGLYIIPDKEPKKKPEEITMKEPEKTEEPVKPKKEEKIVPVQMTKREKAKEQVKYNKLEESLKAVESQDVDTIPERKLDFQYKLSVSSDKIKIEVWDRYKEDGDIFSLKLNEKWVVRKQLLVNKPLEMELDLNEGENYLVLHADNLGKVPPNTAAIAISDGKSRTIVRIKSDEMTSGTIKINYKP